MLSLITGDTLQSESNLRVRWCVDKEDLVALKTEKANHVHIFFVVVYENGKEDRFLIPMDELMTYLPLRFPGEHLILAQIVWEESKGSKSTRKSWTERKEGPFKKYDRNKYRYSVLNSKRDEIDLLGLAHAMDERGSTFREPNLSAALRVNVPQEFFPKEPPTWMKRWVNLGYEYDAVDQCQFRRRVVCAPFFLTGFLVMRSVFGLLAMLLYLGLGFRGVNPSVLWHPWRTSLDGLDEQRQHFGQFFRRHNSWFMEYADGRKKSKLWWLLNPFVHVLVWLCLEATSRWTGMTYLELVSKCVLYVLSILQAVPGASWLLIALIAVATTGALLLVRLVKKYRASEQQQEALPEVQERKRQEREEAERLALEEQTRILTCEYVPKRRPSIADIPLQYRTISLRFQAVKALVCRPFAGH